MTYTYPYAFLLFLPLVFAAWRMLRRSRARGVKFALVSRIPVRSPTWRVVVANIAPYLLLIGLSLLIIAAARPRTIDAGKNSSSIKVDAIAISMVLDISGSMNALDLTPKGVSYSKDTTRLSVVKRFFADFVKKRPDDLISLVAFGTYATARMPLTSDHETLLDVLKGVEIPERQDELQTAVGDGLSVGLLRVKDAKPKSKIVILLSDGECNAGEDPQMAVEAAAKMGVKVYTIGVGTKARIVPFLVNHGGRSFVVQDRSGFDEALLKNIAETTSGKYFAVNDREALEKALEEIDKLERTPIEVEKWNCWNEHFPVFLFAGIMFIVLGGVLSVSAVRRLV